MINLPKTRSRFAQLLFLSWLPCPVFAHGIIGQRIFPSTHVAGDPFVADELLFIVEHRKTPGHGHSVPRQSEANHGHEPAHGAETGGLGNPVTTEVAVEFSKRIGSRFAVSIGSHYEYLDFDAEDDEDGFSNLEVGARYQFFSSTKHETVATLEFKAEVGNTGSEDVGAGSHSTLSPALLFAKGFNDLPAPLASLRPLAVTAAVAGNVPTDSETDGELNPTTLSTGFSLQYHLSQLKSATDGSRLAAPFSQLVPLVEFAFETCLDRGCDGETTGTANPGVMWIGRRMQMGLEGTLPINERSGDNVGVLGVFNLFLADVYPRRIIRPSQTP